MTTATLADRPAAPAPAIPCAAPIALVDLMKYEEFAGRKRFTRTDCDFLERVGVLDERYELLDGEIISKMGHNRLHAVVMVLLAKWLNSVFSADRIQCQLPVEVANEDQTTNQPEPDASVLSRSALEFLDETPGAGDVELVIEVSDTSLAQDIRVKSTLYARAGFPEYWVLDVVGRRLYVHREPSQGGYGEVITITKEERIAPLSAPEKAVSVSDLLPPLVSAS